MESILTSIKKLLGITEDDESFDSDIITDINSVFLNLKQKTPTRFYSSLKPSGSFYLNKESHKYCCKS